MTRPTPLPWVKSWTSSLSDPDWLMLPIGQRGVFLELIKLAGIAYPRGIVKGSDEGIAAVIRSEIAVVTQAIDRLSSKPYRSLKRFAGGVRIVNWDKYQAPDRFLSHDQRGAPVAGAWLGRGESRGRERKEGDKKHPLLDAYSEWVASGSDFDELNRLATKYPSLDLAEELIGFMDYADRRAAAGDAYVNYIAAFRNHLKSQFEYHKKRGWVTPFALPELGSGNGSG